MTEEQKQALMTMNCPQCMCAAIIPQGTYFICDNADAENFKCDWRIGTAELTTLLEHLHDCAKD